MEKFKFDIYLKETGNLFPEVESLNSYDRAVILSNILKLLGLNKNSELFVEIERNLSSKDFDEDYVQNINKILKGFNFETTDYLFLVWNNDDIDKVKTKVLIENWSYIWYGDSDEAVVVYDNENSKILLITHYGRVFYN